MNLDYRLFMRSFEATPNTKNNYFFSIAASRLQSKLSFEKKIKSNDELTLRITKNNDEEQYTVTLGKMHPNSLYTNRNSELLKLSERVKQFFTIVRNQNLERESFVLRQSNLRPQDHTHLHAATVLATQGKLQLSFYTLEKLKHRLLLRNFLVEKPIPSKTLHKHRKLYKAYLKILQKIQLEFKAHNVDKRLTPNDAFKNDFALNKDGESTYSPSP